VAVYIDNVLRNLPKCNILPPGITVGLPGTSRWCTWYPLVTRSERPGAYIDVWHANWWMLNGDWYVISLARQSYVTEVQLETCRSERTSPRLVVAWRLQVAPLVVSRGMDEGRSSQVLAWYLRLSQVNLLVAAALLSSTFLCLATSYSCPVSSCPVVNCKYGQLLGCKQWRIIPRIYIKRRRNLGTYVEIRNTVNVITKGL